MTVLSVTSTACLPATVDLLRICPFPGVLKLQSATEGDKHTYICNTTAMWHVHCTPKKHCFQLVRYFLRSMCASVNATHTHTHTLTHVHTCTHTHTYTHTQAHAHTHSNTTSAQTRLESDVRLFFVQSLSHIRLQSCLYIHMWYGVLHNSHGREPWLPTMPYKAY